MVVGVGVEVVVPLRVLHVLLVAEFAVEHATHLGCSVNDLLFLVDLCLCVCVCVCRGGGLRGRLTAAKRKEGRKDGRMCMYRIRMPCPVQQT